MSGCRTSITRKDVFGVARKTGTKIAIVFFTIFSIVAAVQPTSAAGPGPIIDDVPARVETLESQVGNLSVRTDRAGAMASAFSSLTPLPYDASSPVQFLLGGGSYAGQPAMAAGLAFAVNDSMAINIGIALSGGEKMGRFGAAWKLGQGAKAETAAGINGGAVKALEARLQRQEAQIRELTAQNLRMQEQLDRLMCLMEKGGN